MSGIELANINGTIAPTDRAVIPVGDHGFLYGDSVYETVRTYGRRPFMMASHLDRLARSGAAIRLAVPWSREHMVQEAERTIQAAGGVADTEFALRIMATRGVGPMGYDLALCRNPNLVILLRVLEPIGRAEREVGIAATVVSVRRNPIEALDPRIKSSNLLNTILAYQEALGSGAQEAILLNTSGHLAEGTLTNVFFVKANTLKTPALDCGLLSGITRELVIDLARSAGIAVAEGRYRREDLAEADEIFLTSTTREIVPVASLDGRAMGPGGAGRGPVTRQLQAMFRDVVDAFLHDATIAREAG